jgi:3-oxoacyl-[acyl-carrier-protein] synthase-1
MEHEPRPFGSPDPTHALGMTLAARNALVAAGTSRLDWIVSDVVYERHRVDEWLFVSGRLHEVLADGARHDRPLLSTGELGAATAPVLLAIACALWRAEAARSDDVLVVAHSDGSERGAVVARRGT